MLAQSLQIGLGRLASGFERAAQNIHRIKQVGHHVSRPAERGDQLRAKARQHDGTSALISLA